MPGVEFIVGTIIGLLALGIGGAQLYFQMADRYDWKPRAGRLKAMLSWAQSRLLFALAVIGVALLVSSWIMYKWPSSADVETQRGVLALEIEGSKKASDPTKAFTAILESDKSDPVVDALLQGRLFFVPAGYRHEHEFAAVVPISHTDMAQRSGPCMKFKDTDRVKGKDWSCEGHPTAVDADHVKSFELDKSTAH